MKESKNRRHSEQFKKSIIHRIANGASVRSLSTQYKIHESLIYQWKKNKSLSTIIHPFVIPTDTPSPDATLPNAIKAKIQILEKQLSVLREALDIFCNG